MIKEKYIVRILLNNIIIIWCCGGGVQWLLKEKVLNKNVLHPKGTQIGGTSLLIL